MDVLNLWQDDPEELLLDLGFGAEEPDITVKIPARFINHKSQARGINIQVFLEAQQNRIDIENPDVRSECYLISLETSLAHFTNVDKSLLLKHSTLLFCSRGKYCLFIFGWLQCREGLITGACLNAT